jgi:NitT/TauT family transport system substrate-binding protein
MIIRFWLVALVAALAAPMAFADTDHVRLSHGYSTSYLPLMVMRDQHLLEAQAAAMGLGKVDTTWQIIDGGNNINDALLADRVDILGIGVPGFVTMWSKTLNMAGHQVIGVSGTGTGGMWLNTNNPKLHSLSDFTAADKIALPGIKTSYAAVVLEMAAAKTFGARQYEKLDALTVGLPHPDATAALLSGKTEIDAHFASPPFSYRELQDPKIHRVFSSMDMFGPLTVIMVMAPKRFSDANPGLMKAFLAAEDKAISFIAGNRREAAAIYIRMSGLKMDQAELEKILADPEQAYSATPVGMMQYADFMAEAGSIKARPHAWTDMFIPQVRDLPGS